MPFSPIVPRPRLAEHEVIGPENLAVRARPEAVHGARFEIHENRPGDIALRACFVVIHVDAFELEVGVAVVSAGGVDAVLGADDFPELGADLVAALAALDVEDLSHFCWGEVRVSRERFGGEI